jgi:aspartate aminotransferase-like enzyme
VGVDVTLAGSQKALMLPPCLSFNAISEKALAASKLSKYDTDKIRAVILDRDNMSPGRSRRARRKDLPDRAPGFNDMMITAP